MGPKAKARAAGKATAKAKHLLRVASTVHALNSSGSVVKNMTVWTDLGPHLKQKPQDVFVKALVLPGSTSTELQLQAVDPRSDETFTAPMEHVWNCNEASLDCLKLRDIGLLQHQNTPAVLDFLRNRFMKNVIYTTADPLLVAVNPFRDLGICTDEWIAKYRDVQSLGTLPPHTFMIARQALDNLHSLQKSQTIIVTGESGAGKTEATKHCMRFFASAKAGLDLRVQNAVMAANPVLEAFGNAKTLRNNNSSRFGRFMRLVIARGGGITGGEVAGFLLEKVRVVSQQPNERSYHIFYQLIKGASSDQRKKLGLTSNVKDYANLSATSGGCPDAPGIDDIQEWKDVLESFRSMQLTQAETDSIISIVAGVLKLGNVQFEGVNIDGQDNAARLDNANTSLLRDACKLLYLDDVESVVEGMVSTVKQIGKDSVTVRIQKNEAQLLCQSLGKAMYDLLFKWIIERLNRTIRPDELKSFMGMLDIFGFEIFKENSLEQLLINITNEFLQKNFVDIVFDREAKLYREEGVSTAELVFTNNKHIIDTLIGNRVCVFSCLADACVSNGSDKIFYGSMVANLKDQPVFIKPNGGESTLVFTIAHTIAEISYSAQGFVGKNMDLLKPDLAEVAKSSSNPVVVEMFRDVSIERGKLGKNQLIGNQFIVQLQEMMAVILSTEPHFIRCVKPNETKKPLDWEADKVLNQLFSLSILEALQLKKLGFSWRRTFGEFIAQFRYLRMDLHELSANASPKQLRDLSSDLAKHFSNIFPKGSFVEGKDWQMGKSMMFMKPKTFETAMLLQARAMEMYEPSVNLIEAFYYRVNLKRSAKAVSSQAVRVQSAMRRTLTARLNRPVSEFPAETPVF